MSTPMQSLADSHGRQFHQFIDKFNTCYAQIGNFLTYQAKEDVPGTAPKKAQNAINEMQNTLHNLSRDVSRFTNSEIDSLKRYGMLSTDRARQLLVEHARVSVDLINKLTRLLSDLRLSNDPTVNVRAIAELDTPARRLAREFDIAEGDLLKRLRER